MENIDEIKESIVKKFDEMLSENLELFETTGKFSSSEIGKNIGKFINEQFKDMRKSHTAAKKKKSSDCENDSDSDADSKEKKSKKVDGEVKEKKTVRKTKKDNVEGEVKEKKTRKPSTWNIYMKKKMAEYKIENEKNGISKNPKEMLADIALLWKEDKATFKVEDE
jgi:hypothetical protein